MLYAFFKNGIKKMKHFSYISYIEHLSYLNWLRATMFEKLCSNITSYIEARSFTLSRPSGYIVCGCV